MKIRNLPRLGASLLCAALALATLNACDPPAAQATGALALVLGAHANAPAPGFTPTTLAAVDEAVSKGSYLAMVVESSQPQVVASGWLKPSGANSQSQHDARVRLQDAVLAQVAGSRAEAPESNPLLAISLAARAVAAEPGPRSMVIVDSMLQTTAPMSFLHEGMLSAAPAEVVAYLTNLGELPDLKGFRVILSGVGDTAPPQLPLPSVQRNALVTLWTTVLQHAGAIDVEVDQTPLTGASLHHVPAVSPVPSEQLAGWPPGCPSQIVITDGQVGFLPDLATFRDPSAAEALLKKVAASFGRCGWKTVHLTGTTADWGTARGRQLLSMARANAVAAELRRMHVPSGAITTSGLGSSFAGFIPDRTPKGVLIPDKAEQNRKVTLTFGK